MPQSPVRLPYNRRTPCTTSSGAIPDGTTRMVPWVCSVHVCSRMFLLTYPRLGWGVGHCLSASGRPEAAIVPASSILLSKPQRRLHRASESVQCVWRAALSKKNEKICALLHSVRPTPCTVVVISCLDCRGRAQSSLAKVSRRRVECLSLPPSESIAHAGSRLHWAVTKAPGIASDATAATTLIQRSLLTSRALPRSACWSSSSECSLLNSALKQTLRASRHAFGPLLPCFSNSYTSLVVLSEPRVQAEARSFDISSRWDRAEGHQSPTVAVSGQCLLPISFELHVSVLRDHRGINGDVKSTGESKNEGFG